MDIKELERLLEQDRKEVYHIYDSVQEARDAGYNIVLDFHNYLLENSHPISKYTRIVNNVDHTLLSMESMGDQYLPRFRSIICTGQRVNVLVDNRWERFMEVVGISKLSRHTTANDHDLLKEMEIVKKELNLAFIRDFEFSGIRIL